MTSDIVALPPSSQLLRLIAEGRRNEAIVQARRDTGLTLDKARGYVDAFLKGNVVLP